MTAVTTKEKHFLYPKEESLLCYHCGNKYGHRSIAIDDKYFCCQGCKTVFEILSQNDLCQYYDIENHPGISLKEANQPIFDFLDNIEIKSQIVDYQDDNITKTTFNIPSIHCSSCIWILENFHKLNHAVVESRVDFLKKQLFISFKTNETTFRKIVETLTSIGYEPLINLESNSKTKTDHSNRDLVSKIAVAGFCTGNIMLFSFPEYFGLDAFSKDFGQLFTWLNLAFGLPVLFYSGSVYFQSVFQSLKKGILNIDAPILLGILASFVRSVIEIVSQTGPGYLDSMSGLVFLLLIGKWFTNKTFNFLSFERNYKSYFPLAVYKLENDQEVPISVNNLKKGDKIRIKNNQIIPADALLYRGKAHIDFSFVTGESALVTKNAGDLIYAGGRHKGEAIDLEIIKEVSQSYLTQLWNNPSFDKSHSDKHKNYQLFTNAVAKYFTIIILLIACAAALYWSFNDGTKAWNAFTAILIIACPCTLSLSYPMAMGNLLRKLGKQKLFLKNVETIENLAKTNAIVFDKTGTITDPDAFELQWQGIPLSDFDKTAISCITKSSNHPLSVAIYNYLKTNKFIEIKSFNEFPGKGISAEVQNHTYKIGSHDFIAGQKEIATNETKVHIAVNEDYKGYFSFTNKYKSFLSDLSNTLSKTHQLHILSGDGNAEQDNLRKLFSDKTEMHFNQSPQQKLDFIKELQNKGKNVVMCGDGLNDAGALMQANVGIAITQDASNFTPASDAILEGNAMENLPTFIKSAKKGMKAVKFSFLVSLVYNGVGLFFAIRGDLQPIIAAILMPISSISVVMSAMLLSGNNEKSQPNSN